LIEILWLNLLLAPLAWLRRTLELRPTTYALLMLPQAQTLLEAIREIRLRMLYLKARNSCPAYQDFLRASGYQERRPWRLIDVPITTKENYVKHYAIEARCFGGRLGGHGDVIDESSGSSGIPNNWVRNAHERADVKRILQLSYGLMFGDPRCILLNCFALGPWATGMNVSMSLADVGILKSIGPDGKKLENTLKLFGSEYRYIVFGYPPFLKAFVDSTDLDLNDFAIDLVVGGEGISEALRAYLRKSFRSVVSSYGASDLEINIGVETDWTICLRSRCANDPEMCRELFGRDTPPMIFQYNPLDYLIETTGEGELAFTICRASGAAPKIRYNLKDTGGTYTFRKLAERLSPHGVAPKNLATRFGCFPILYVYGRSDLSVAFFGAKVYPTDLEATILGHSTLARRIRSFQFASYEDEHLNRRLAISLELAEDVTPSAFDVEAGELRSLFYRGLASANQDFREVSRLFDVNAIEVSLFACATGPFADADIRLKRQYVGPQN
jgi:phenylacetate-coenzyme A ligase PaaK-like adenylate-forming protein